MRKLEPLGDSQKAACFSEIPLDLLARLIENRSLYGIGFHQRFLLSQGGARGWYLDKGSAAAAAFRAVVRMAMTEGIDPTDAVWRVTPFVDHPGEYPTGAYRFEWEREWRVPGGVRFRPQDVAFLFIPEEFHQAVRSLSDTDQVQNSQPSPTSLPRLFRCLRRKR